MPGPPIVTAPCGHAELDLSCDCGQKAAAWWAEVKRRLAEASPRRYAALTGEPAPPVQDHPTVPVEPEPSAGPLTLF